MYACIHNQFLEITAAMHVPGPALLTFAIAVTTELMTESTPGSKVPWLCLIRKDIRSADNGIKATAAATG